LATTDGYWLHWGRVSGYQWRRCDASGANCVAIPGATSPSYTLTGADVGSTVRAVVTTSNPVGSASATSSSTPVIQALTLPASTGAPAVSGTTTDGQRLTVSNGTWSGYPSSFAYQWQRCDSSCSNIAGATAGSYVLTSADVGDTVRATVTASNAAGSASAVSGASAQIAPAPPRNTSRPTIAGTAAVGSTVSAGPGTWSGTTPIGYHYQWRRCTTSAGCTRITTATASTYVVTSADVGYTVSAVVTATNQVSSATASTPNSGTVGTAAPPAPTLTSTPAAVSSDPSPSFS